MTHGSLFSGIGGFDIAADWMGWENIFHCEWEEFPKRILKYYWPNAISYDDIKKTDFTIHRGRIDILTGGFPCQPYSAAGKRRGKEDERHLWPEMLRAIREIQPRWVVGENVRGLINWNGGLVFDEVQADLEAEGYEVQPFLLPAAGVNAPHRRDRVWIVAYSGSNEHKGGLDFGGNRKEAKRSGRSTDREVREENQRERLRVEFRDNGYKWDASNSHNERLQRGENKRSIEKSRENRKHLSAGFVQSAWEEFPTQPPVRHGDDGFSARLDGITFPKWRNESIKAGGNAIVPQVALQIFRAIEQYESLNRG